MALGSDLTLSPGQALTRLRAKGHWSPIVKQMRAGRKPDGICMVCGSCAAGFPAEQNRCGRARSRAHLARGKLKGLWHAL
jgi:hypothetical protein